MNCLCIIKTKIFKIGITQLVKDTIYFRIYPISKGITPKDYYSNDNHHSRISYILLSYMCVSSI